MQRPRRRQSVTAEKTAARDVAKVPLRSGVRTPESPTRKAQNRTWLHALVLVGGTILAYLPVWHAGFIWDDRSFVVDNQLIHRSDGLVGFWFTTQPVDFYPVTSSLLWMEWRVWGGNPVPYHVVNVLLHSLSAILLWRVLSRLNVIGSWLAAALFAVHPVNVESVAWIAERKNTLAMVFFLWSLLAYVRADRSARPAVQAAGTAESDPSTAPVLVWRSYCLSVAAFLLALLSKTVVAPMPLVLIGTAWWRRGRVDRRDVKLMAPFFGMAIALGLVALWFQSHRAIGSEVVRTDSAWARLAGAGWAIWFYLYKAIVPFGLSTIYPRWEVHEHEWWSYLPVMLAAGCLLVFWRARRSWGRAPLAALGYFVVMLLPVLGFLDIGFMRASLVADRWQYFSMIGPISCIAGILATSWSAARPHGVSLTKAFAATLLAGFGILTWKQSSLYADPGTFWQAALLANPNSWVAHSNLGDVLFERGKLDDAATHFRAALDLEPNNPTAHYNLGGFLREQGRLEEAAAQFQQTLELQPNYSAAHYYLGVILGQEGQFDAAIDHLRTAVEIRPDYADAHDSLAFLLIREGRTDEGVVHLRAALAVRPDNAEAHANLAGVLSERGQVLEASLHYQRAIALRPDYALAHQGLGEILERAGHPREAILHYEKAVNAQSNFAEAWRSLAWVLATSSDASVRNGVRAVQMAQEAQRFSGGGNPQFLETLAAAYAEAGRFSDALDTATQALERATAHHGSKLASRLRTQIALYQTGSPVRDRAAEDN
ncbi:MAG: tetratricopeptide repeat protein [Polyangiaceae bacterium]|jgi:tetratricopeptide (TPR) repeat protein